MPFKPGQPKVGGRKAGTPNKRTLTDREHAEAGGALPLAYMLEVMRDPTADAHRRDDMAKAAAPYLHAKLSSDTAMNVNIGTEQIGENAEEVGIRVEFVRPRAVKEEAETKH